MTLRKPLVITDGQIEQIQSGDTLDATITDTNEINLTNNNASTINIGQPVYAESDGNVDLAQANAQGTVEVIGLVADATIAASASGQIITDGVLEATTDQWDAVTGDTGGLTVGDVYYLSAASAGELTTTAPSSTGNFVKRVGTALSTTQMELEFGQTVKL